MCYELCGPPIDGTPEDMADYDMWLREEGPYAPIEDTEDDEIEVISERESYQRFDHFLDAVFSTVTVCGYDYDQSRALKTLDEVAYREEYNNWLDNELKEGSFKLED